MNRLTYCSGCFMAGMVLSDAVRNNNPVALIAVAVFVAGYIKSICDLYHQWQEAAQ